VKWRVYYSQEIYSGPVEETPTRDVQAIAQSDPDHGWQVVAGTDYYVWWNERWVGVDKFGLYDYLVEPGWKKVLFGRTLTSREYNAVWQRMMSDPELPEKTGAAKWERRP